jgi:hypothetical protein
MAHEINLTENSDCADNQNNRYGELENNQDIFKPNYPFGPGW